MSVIRVKPGTEQRPNRCCYRDSVADHWGWRLDSTWERRGQRQEGWEVCPGSPGPASTSLSSPPRAQSSSVQTDSPILWVPRHGWSAGAQTAWTWVAGTVGWGAVPRTGPECNGQNWGHPTQQGGVSQGVQPGAPRQVEMGWKQEWFYQNTHQVVSLPGLKPYEIRAFRVPGWACISDFILPSLLTALFFSLGPVQLVLTSGPLHSALPDACFSPDTQSDSLSCISQLP